MRTTRTLSLLGGALLGLLATGPDALAQWTTSGSNAVTSAGINNVGIGNTTPTRKLDVNGDGDVATNFFWGANDAMLRNDQGGSLELGAFDLGAGNRGAGTGTPYIDFHFNGLTQDYNVRLMNNADGMLSLAATTFYTWANIGVNTTTPQAKLHINNGGLLVEGTAGSTPLSGSGTRMMWIPAKTAFRAGSVNGSQWDNANIGSYSVAFGQNTRADAPSSFAGGRGSAAYGQFAEGAFAYGINDTADQFGSVALGDNNRSFGAGAFTAGSMNYAEGAYAVAMGQSDSVFGDRSVAIGYQNKVNGDIGTALGAYNTVNGYYCMAANAGNTASSWYSTAFGFGNTASGDQSFTGGIYNTASGTNATTFGDHNVASGTGATTLGSYNTASGAYATAMGNHTTAQAYKSLVIGRYNVVSGTTGSWVSTEPVFVIGNGTGTGVSSSNAITMYKNGNLVAAGTGTFSSSDARLKRDVVPATDLLAKLENIQPVYFSFNDTETRPAGRQLGFIAQEIEKEFPEMVTRDEKGYLAVAYGNMSAVAIEAIKEQQKRIDAISAEKSDVSSQLAAANARIAEQDARIARIEALLHQLTGCCPEPGAPTAVPSLK